MSKVVYRPEPGSDDSTTAYGYSFADGKSVDVTDEFHLAKFRGNPFFVVDGVEEAEDVVVPEQPKGAKARPPKREGDKAKSPPKDAKPPADKPLPYEAKLHDGKWSVMQGDKVIAGITKADAEAFNTWSDADKAKFLALPN